MQTVSLPFSLAFGKYKNIEPAPDTGFSAHYFYFVHYGDLYSKVDKREGMLTDT